MVRIIPCLDMIDGKVVKGKRFKDIVDINSPEVLAEYYYKTGADELVFYDINASIEGRNTYLDPIIKAMSKINIPFCIGGGISSIRDAERCIEIGANKVSINSAAIKNPNLIEEIAIKLGSQAVVLAIDVMQNKEESWSVYVEGGKRNTGLDAIKWVRRAVDLGAGEIVVNSIDGDGMKKGYDIKLLKKIKDSVNVPVIASGGAGKFKDFYEAIMLAKVDGVLAASVFHYGDIKINDLKDYLIDKGISMKY